MSTGYIYNRKEKMYVSMGKNAQKYVSVFVKKCLTNGDLYANIRRSLASDANETASPKEICKNLKKFLTSSTGYARI